jgi:Flp pilus assembly protein TadG
MLRLAKLDTQHGQSLVELALLLPVLVLLAMGILDLGRGMQAYTVATNAAREAARYASVKPTDAAGITAIVHYELQRGGLAPANATITTSGSGQGNPFRVDISYRFPLVSGFFGSAQITIQASAEAVIF